MENITQNKRFLGKLKHHTLLEKTEDGLTMCRWCGKGVKPPRRTMCSNECAHQLRLRCSGSYLRRHVYKRDKGICSECGIDTKALAKEALSINEKEKEKIF